MKKVMFVFCVLLVALTAFAPKPIPMCPTPTPPNAVQFVNFNAEYKNGVGLMIQVQSVMDLELLPSSLHTRTAHSSDG